MPRNHHPPRGAEVTRGQHQHSPLAAEATSAPRKHQPRQGEAAASVGPWHWPLPLAEATGPHPAVGAALLPAEAAASAHPMAEQPLPEGAVAWAHRAEAAGPHLGVAAASAQRLPAAEAVSAPQAEAAAWARQGEAAAWGPQAEAAGHPHQAAWADQAASADHPRQEASVALLSRPASAGRHRGRQVGQAALAWASPPPDPGPQRPGTAPTAAGRTSRASVFPLPPPQAPPARAPGLTSPRSIPGKRRRSRRTRLPPCCGSRRSCRRSRAVHLHSVHHVCWLGMRYRRVDQVHGHARRVVHPDPHCQPR